LKKFKKNKTPLKPLKADWTWN